MQFSKGTIEVPDKQIKMEQWIQMMCQMSFLGSVQAWILERTVWIYVDVLSQLGASALLSLCSSPFVEMETHECFIEHECFTRNMLPETLYLIK